MLLRVICALLLILHAFAIRSENSPPGLVGNIHRFDPNLGKVTQYYALQASAIGTRSGLLPVQLTCLCRVTLTQCIAYNPDYHLCRRKILPELSATDA